MPRSPQTYFVSAYHGELMSGPVPMAFVDPSTVPRRDSIDEYLREIGPSTSEAS